MGKLVRDALEQLKEILWAVFLLCLVLGALVLIFGRQVGYGTMAWIGLGFALLLIAVFGAVFALNVIGVLVVRAFKMLGRRKDLL